MSLYIGRYCLFMTLFGLLWCVLRQPWTRRNPRECCLMLFGMTLCALLCLVLRGTWTAPRMMLASAARRLQTGEGIQMQPFHTIVRQIRYASREEKLINLWGNILLFLPYGFFLPLLWRRYRHPLHLLLMCLLLPLAIEGSQLFIHRMTDVDDVLLNCLGGLLGGVVFALLHRLFPRFTQQTLIRS